VPPALQYAWGLSEAWMKQHVPRVKVEIHVLVEAKS